MPYSCVAIEVLWLGLDDLSGDSQRGKGQGHLEQVTMKRRVRRESGTIVWVKLKKINSNVHRDPRLQPFLTRLCQAEVSAASVPWCIAQKGGGVEEEVVIRVTDRVGGFTTLVLS